MDPTLAAFIPLIAAGFGGMWLYRLKDKDDRIAELKDQNAQLTAKVDSLNDIVGRNTSALDRLAPALESLVTAQRRQYQSQSTATVTDPALAERGS
jgi:uncharacterized coiled-coil protein SlyX